MGRVEEFVEVARRFVDWAERGEMEDRLALEVGSALFAAAWAIRDEPLEVADDEVEAEWKDESGAFHHLGVGYYWQALQPFADDVDPDLPVLGLGDPSDDLFTIYRYVKEGLVHWDNGRREQAIWAWVFDFRIRWGEHLIDVLGMLHRVATSGDNLH